MKKILFHSLLLFNYFSLQCTEIEGYSSFKLFEEKIQELFPHKPSDDDRKQVFSLLPPQDQCIIFDAYINSGSYNAAIFISPILKRSHLPASLIEKAAYNNEEQDVEIINSTLPSTNCNAAHLKKAIELSRYYHFETLAFEAYNNNIQLLFPHNNPSDDERRQALNSLALHDQHMIFNAYIDCENYDKALFISPILHSYLPAILIQKAAYDLKSSLEIMKQSSLPETINPKNLKKAMKRSHQYQQETIASEKFKSVIQKLFPNNLNNLTDDDYRKAFAQLDPVDQCTLFNYFIDTEQYNNAVVLSPILPDYSPASLIVKAAHHLYDVLETMEQSPSSETINETKLKKAMRLSYQYQREAEQKEAKTTLTIAMSHLFNMAIEEGLHELAIDLAQHLREDYKPALYVLTGRESNRLACSLVDQSESELQQDVNIQLLKATINYTFELAAQRKKEKKGELLQKKKYSFSARQNIRSGGFPHMITHLEYLFNCAVNALNSSLAIQLARHYIPRYKPAQVVVTRTQRSQGPVSGLYQHIDNHIAPYFENISIKNLKMIVKLTTHKKALQ